MTASNVGKKRLRRNDLILILGLLTAATVGILYLFLWRGTGDTVTVTVNGELYGVYSLSEDVTRDIETDGHHNRLVIREGKAMMESADCPDGICVAHRPIYRDGESIVCLPHGVVITVDVQNEENGTDIVI